MGNPVWLPCMLTQYIPFTSHAREKKVCGTFTHLAPSKSDWECASDKCVLTCQGGGKYKVCWRAHRTCAHVHTHAHTHTLSLSRARTRAHTHSFCRTFASTASTATASARATRPLSTESPCTWHARGCEFIFVLMFVARVHTYVGMQAHTRVLANVHTRIR